MFLFLLLGSLLAFSTPTYAALAGGRANAVSGGINAFTGVSNAGAAVWIEDRFDLGAYWYHQKTAARNIDNNPLFPPGKYDTSYRLKDFFLYDIAINKRFSTCLGGRLWDWSLSFAAYTTPPYLRTRTKMPIPLTGDTPMRRLEGATVYSGIFSVKLNSSHSIGFSVDYFYLEHLRNGFQNLDNPEMSVSPGNVTNRGKDHSSGVGLSLGWLWKMTKSWDLGISWSGKTPCGRFKKYQGYEPERARNFAPQQFTAGMAYKFNPKWIGRFEVNWTNLGNVPDSNDGVLPDGTLNLHKRGSRKGPGPGLRDVTLIGVGIGHKFNERISFGAGFAHRLKPATRNSQIIAGIFGCQTSQDVFAAGVDIKFKKSELFIGWSHFFKKVVKGPMPDMLGGGAFTTQKVLDIVNISWGYQY